MGAQANIYSVRVVSVQSPAWLERGDELIPLSVGTELRRKDIVRTGARARAVISLGEDSKMHLGSDARMVFHQLHSAGAGKGGLKGLIDVPRGAFLFSHLPASYGRDRHIRVRFDATSVDIYGDAVNFAGESGNPKSQTDIICLFEGALEVRLDENAELPRETLDKPNYCFISAKNNMLEIQPDQRKELMKLTELAPRTTGITQMGGRWTANLVSMPQGDRRLKQTQLILESIGLPISNENAVVKGKRWTRLQVRHFISRREAQVFAKILKGRFNITSPWVTREK